MAGSLGTRVRASWRGTVIAESDRTVVVEGNHYLPPDDVRQDCLVPSDNHSTCPWKGKASYYDVVVNVDHNPDAAWCYPTPSQAANAITGRIAFWNGLKVHAGEPG
jgi:uncharacterized protein (DUF427 family)